MCTYIPWPCDQTGKDCLQPRNRSGKEAGKSCAVTGAGALQPPEKLQSTLFFFRRRGAKRGTAAGRADGEAEMGVGGEVLLFWQNPSFLLQISLREDFAQHERLSVRPSPSQDPAPRSRRLPGAWTALGTAPTGTAESQGGPEHLPPPGSLPGQRGNAQTTFKVGTVAGSRHQPHARTTCLEGSRVPTLTARVLLRSLKRRAPDPTLLPLDSPPSCHWEAQHPQNPTMMNFGNTSTAERVSQLQARGVRAGTRRALRFAEHPRSGMGCSGAAAGAGLSPQFPLDGMDLPCSNSPSMLQQPFRAPTAPLRSGCAGRGARQSLTGAAPEFA